MNNESAYSSRGCQPALCTSRVKIWQKFAGAKRVFLTFPEMYSNVNTIWISRKNVVSLYSEEERARKQGFSPLFLAKNQGFLPSKNENLSQREKFLLALLKFFWAR